MVDEHLQAGSVRVRPLPPTQNRVAALFLAGQVWYHPGTARWYLQRAGGDDPTLHAQRGDGRALRTMRVTGLIEVVDSAGAAPDGRGAFQVRMTAAGRDRYRPAV